MTHGKRLRIVFFGSGSFGLPTLMALRAAHDVVGVVSQPARPSGRGQVLTPTPIAGWATAHSLTVTTPEDVNDAETIGRLKALEPDALVVIAFGQKLGPAVLARRFAINLHASILPAYRGAAPINWAILDGAAVTGVSVIALASRMDAGDVFATRELAIGEDELASELHDRLSLLGPEVVLETLAAWSRGEARGVPQDETRATRARKLSRADSRVDVTALSATEVRRLVNGLAPWPGVDLLVAGEPVRIVRCRVHPTINETPGVLRADRLITCRDGAIEVLEVVPPGARQMSFAEYCNGRRLAAGAAVGVVPAAQPTA